MNAGRSPWRTSARRRDGGAVRRGGHEARPAHASPEKGRPGLDQALRWGAVADAVEVERSVQTDARVLEIAGSRHRISAGRIDPATRLPVRGHDLQALAGLV